MVSLLLGAAALLLLWWGLKAYGRADPKKLAGTLRGGGGVAALVVAAFLGLRGHFETALALGIFGLGLLGWTMGVPNLFGGGRGERARLRSPYVLVEVDRGSGDISGRIVAGALRGQELDSIDVETLRRLAAEVDPESLKLLAAYLDRRAPGWRENTHQRSSAGQGSGRPEMTREQAYEILGLKPGASAEEVARAHRALIKKFHPDQGGSTYLASQINQAKEMLLQRHR